MPSTMSLDKDPIFIPFGYSKPECPGVKLIDANNNGESDSFVPKSNIWI